MDRSVDPPPNRRQSDVFVRFHNLSTRPLAIVWLDYDGQEKQYAELQPRTSYTQATYCSHPWRLKDGARTVGHYCGETATITAYPNGACKIEAGLVRSAASTPDPTSANPSWGRYRQRGSVGGIPICAFDCVSQEALDIAAATLECMLAHVEPAVVVRMARLGAEVAIIGRGQSTTDIPAHAHLKGQSCGDGRDFDAGTRGLGGTVACPITSVGEENVTMKGDFRYPSESILVHEFAHAVMNIGLFGTSQHDAIKAAYENAVKLRLYPDCYMSSNADEYWAEGTQAWFHATVRQDVTAGITTRAELRRRDPQLAAVMEEVWGNGSWKYPDTAPKKFKGYRRERRLLAALCGFKGMSIQEKP